jgi:uncharacterized protein (TIGR03089 family)
MTTALAPGGVTAALLGPLLAQDPHRPRLIWHGAGRTELSTATLANWSAKTAGLLVDELGTSQGQVVEWRTRRSWQSVPLLLGTWWAGLVVTDIDDAAVTEAIAGFIDEDDGSELKWGSAAENAYVASTHPFGLGSGELPDYHQHVSAAVLPQADRFIPRRPGVTADSAAMLTADGPISVAEILGRARRAGVGIGPSGRVLSVLDLSLPDVVCDGLLGALAADGSLIQVVGRAAADPAGLAVIAQDERATVTLGIELAGLPRLDA